MEEQIKHDALRQVYFMESKSEGSFTTIVNDTACENCPKRNNCHADCTLTDDEAFEIWWEITKGELKEV